MRWLMAAAVWAGMLGCASAGSPERESDAATRGVPFGEAFMGMNQAEVRESQGDPDERTLISSAREYWRYTLNRNHTEILELEFNDGKVTGYRDTRFAIDWEYPDSKAPPPGLLRLGRAPRKIGPARPTSRFL